MMRCLLAVFLCWATQAFAEALRFEAYSVGVVAGGRRSDVDLSDPRSRRYADALRSEAGAKVNFAGHFVLAQWGCGASCVMGAAIDTQTGAVAWLPFTVCCWARDVDAPLEFRADSRLLIVHGSRNEEGSGTHDYVFDGRAFGLISDAQ